MTDAANFGWFLHQIFLGSIQDISCIKRGHKTHNLSVPGLAQTPVIEPLIYFPSMYLLNEGR